MKKSIHLGKFLIFILFPLFVGLLSSLLSSNGMELYKTMTKPPLSPPAFIFPIVWTILYVMMGAASYIVTSVDTTTSETKASDQMIGMTAYLIQLCMNFFWSLLFFNLQLYIFAFFWLLIMYTVIIICTFYYFRIDWKAGLLMFPLSIWMIFAAYLNASIAFFR